MKRQRWKTEKHGRQTFSVSSGGDAEALAVSSEDPRRELAATPPGPRPAPPPPPRVYRAQGRALAPALSWEHPLFVCFFDFLIFILF